MTFRQLAVLYLTGKETNEIRLFRMQTQEVSFPKFYDKLWSIIDGLVQDTEEKSS